MIRRINKRPGSPIRGERCRICGGRHRQRALEAKARAGALVWLLRCRDCGTVQPEVLPSDEELNDYYDTYSYGDSAAWQTSAATDASLSTLAMKLERYRRSGTLLDVGCGAGAVLKAFRSRGWDVEGLELSRVAADRLASDGFRVHVGRFENLEVGRDRYDVIIMSELIEHLGDPGRTLECARATLRPGGALYLTTPNFDSLSRRLLGQRWRAIEVPEHLTYLSQRPLERMLERAGFVRVAVWSEGTDPFAIGARLGLGRGAAPSTHLAATEELRNALARRRSLRVVKRVLNSVLSLTRLGDTLKAIAEKPPAESVSPDVETRRGGKDRGSDHVAESSRLPAGSTGSPSAG